MNGSQPSQMRHISLQSSTGEPSFISAPPSFTAATAAAVDLFASVLRAGDELGLDEGDGLQRLHGLVRAQTALGQQPADPLGDRVVCRCTNVNHINGCLSVQARERRQTEFRNRVVGANTCTLNGVL